MEKPITIRREEFGQAVAEAINNSGLPAFVIADLLEGMIGSLRQLEAEQARRDLALWEKEQKQEEAKAEETQNTETEEKGEPEVETELAEEEAENGRI